jgi:RNA polymerase sigma-70 factor (ECF subfamily)
MRGILKIVSGTAAGKKSPQARCLPTRLSSLDVRAGVAEGSVACRAMIAAAGGVTMVAETLPVSTPETPGGSFERDFVPYQSYLYLLARSHIGRRYQARIDPSDIVQQTLLHAHQKQSQFRGATEAERMAWLRQILANNLADAVRGLARAKRDVARERPLDHDVNDSFTRVDGWLAAVQSSPSQQAVRSEELVQLADALTSLPMVQREAIVLHHLQGLPLAEVGQRLEKTPAAVAGLLHRGLKRLREVMSGGGTDRSSLE